MALLALTLQLGLAFGHVHVTPTSATTLSATASPQSDTGDSGDADYCATCAVLALLTGAQTASAPFVAPPAELATVDVTFLVEAACIDSYCAAFRSRAPPRS